MFQKLGSLWTPLWKPQVSYKIRTASVVNQFNVYYLFIEITWLQREMYASERRKVLTQKFILCFAKCRRFITTPNLRNYDMCTKGKTPVRCHWQCNLSYLNEHLEVSLTVTPKYTIALAGPEPISKIFDNEKYLRQIC